MAQKIIMAWSKCKVEIGKTGDSGAMAGSLTSIGYVKDRSAILEASEGDTLEAVASGGERIAKEGLEGGFTLTVRVIEPSNTLLKDLGLGTAGTAEGDFNMQTHLVSGNYSVQVTPKNKGARGIKAPTTNITYRPGWSEEEGFYADLVFEILHGEANYWYSHFSSPGISPTED